MRFASLGSGSKGNATLIHADEQYLLVDCGFSAKETIKRLGRLGVSPDQITAILVSHEHSDHIAGVPALSNQYSIPVYMSAGTQTHKKAVQARFVTSINIHQSFTVGQLTVHPVVVPHDAKEPCQFIIEGKCGKKFGVLTDLGHITPYIVEAYRQCDAIALEFNYDPKMLTEGPYPPSLKRRVGGQYGHLSNEQSAQFLQQLDFDRIDHIMISHISEKNNTPEKALGSIQLALGHVPDCIKVAEQDQGLSWVSIGTQTLTEVA